MSHPAGPEWHDRWEDLMIAALDGRAAEDERRELDRHLADCAACRATFAEYGDLFLGLREAADTELPREFWDALAAGIERRVAAPDPSSKIIDLRERTASRRGWSGVAGGLVAAGLAILVLAGVYLKLPRTGAEPQAFTTPARERTLPDGVEDPSAVDPGRLALEEDAEGTGAAGLEEALAGSGEATAESAGLLALATGLDAEAEDAGEALSVFPEARDPLTALAEAEETFAGLTSAEAEELLRSLESQT